MPKILKLVTQPAAKWTMNNLLKPTLHLFLHNRFWKFYMGNKCSFTSSASKQPRLFITNLYKKNYMSAECRAPNFKYLPFEDQCPATRPIPRNCTYTECQYDETQTTQQSKRLVHSCIQQAQLTLRFVWPRLRPLQKYKWSKCSIDTKWKLIDEYMYLIFV